MGLCSSALRARGAPLKTKPNVIYLTELVEVPFHGPKCIFSGAVQAH